MKNYGHKLYEPIVDWDGFKLKIFLESVVVGVFSGAVVVAFRYALGMAEMLRTHLFSCIDISKLTNVIFWILLLIGVAYVLDSLGKWESLAGGSGIPQVKGELTGLIKMNWARILVAKVTGGVLAIGVGLSLGREGPSVQLGAATAKGFSKLLGRTKIEEKYLIIGGASAGLSAAFNAPLAGTVFAVEELAKNFSPAVLISAMSASLAADFVSKRVFGLSPIFNVPHLVFLPLNQYGYLICLGVIAGIFGALFNSTLLRTLDIYGKIRLPRFIKLTVVFFLATILGFNLPQILGGGNALVDSLVYESYGIWLLLLLWFGKFIFTALSFSTRVPGGIFLPLLVFGALTGNICGWLFINLFSINPDLLPSFTVFAMAALFTAIVKAPVTGCILITEMTGSFEHFLALVTVSMIAYVVSDLLKSAPIYDSLLDRLCVVGSKGVLQKNKGVLTEFSVSFDSKHAGKMIKEIPLPKDCLIVNIKRGDNVLIPKGNTKVLAGDFIYILASEEQVHQIKLATKEIG